jgi:hypothetical protein
MLPHLPKLAEQRPVGPSVLGAPVVCAVHEDKEGEGKGREEEGVRVGSERKTSVYSPTILDSSAISLSKQRHTPPRNRTHTYDVTPVLY